MVTRHDETLWQVKGKLGKGCRIMLEHEETNCSDRDRSGMLCPHSELFKNAICLAPMVRAGSLPFRTLCLKYGATLVFGEEIIDRRLLRCKRVENEVLGTVDFIVDGRSLVFRTTMLEKSNVIFQLGTCDPEAALSAARMVQQDVAGIDVNMGCPKKFSIQGGMGAALLKSPETARGIIETLSRNLDIPVTAKIRIIDSVEETIGFMQMLESAGAAAITVHLRQKTTSSTDPADWEVLPKLVRCVSIPVIANGDVYTRQDADRLMLTSGCSGVMMGRPLLLNPSLLIASPAQVSDSGNDVGPSSEWKTLREVICDFLVECVKYEPPYQVVKYTIQEMMSLRRHSQDRLRILREAGLNFGRMKDEYPQVAAAKSIREMCEVFSVSGGDNMIRGVPGAGLGQELLKKRKFTERSDSTGESDVLVSDLRFEDSYFDREDN